MNAAMYNPRTDLCNAPDGALSAVQGQDASLHVFHHPFEDDEAPAPEFMGRLRVLSWRRTADKQNLRLRGKVAVELLDIGLAIWGLDLIVREETGLPRVNLPRSLCPTPHAPQATHTRFVGTFRGPVIRQQFSNAVWHCLLEHEPRLKAELYGASA